MLAKAGPPIFTVVYQALYCVCHRVGRKMPHIVDVAYCMTMLCHSRCRVQGPEQCISSNVLHICLHLDEYNRVCNIQRALYRRMPECTGWSPAPGEHQPLLRCQLALGSLCLCQSARIPCTVPLFCLRVPSDSKPELDQLLPAQQARQAQQAQQARDRTSQLPGASEPPHDYFRA